MVTLQKFTTLIDLVTYFKNEDVCRKYLAKIRWNGSPVCPHAGCGHDKVFEYADGKLYKCAKCRKQFSVRIGTIFQDSKIPLSKWFASIYLITSHKKGISSIQLAKDIGVQQRTAWFMMHRVRYTFGMNPSTEPLTGDIEADETFIGGAEKNKHKNKRMEGTQGRSVKTKTPVAGVIQRGGELRVEIVENTKGENLQPFVIKNIAVGSNLHTDEWWGYKGLSKLYKHQIVKHNEKQYVVGDVHTNTLEGFWSLLKRGVDGIYHSLSDKHLQKYLNEFAFRYNTRSMSENYRFDMMLNNINGYISYKTLTNKPN